MNQNGLMPLHGTPYLGSTINLLKTSKIIKTYNAFKGTQLKLILMFENKQEVLFKPKWYVHLIKILLYYRLYCNSNFKIFMLFK